MSNFSMGRAANYTPGVMIPSLFNWVFADVSGDVGIVSKVLSKAVTPGQLLRTKGNFNTPAEITLNGSFKAGSSFNVNVHTIGGIFGAPLVISEDLSANEVCILWADLIRGINDSTAEADFEKVLVRCNQDGFIVALSDLVIVSNPVPPAIVTIPAGVWVPVGNALYLDPGTTTATGLLVV